MPLPPDFHRECLYAPDQWFVHDVLELDVDEQRIVTLTDTTRLGALVEAQRDLPGHPKHVPGAVAIQITGTLGVLHAAYVQGLKPTAGWVGFGTHIRNARFRRLGTIGPPLHVYMHCTRRRQLRGTWFLDYTFRFEQDDEVIYESDQSAAWTRSA